MKHLNQIPACILCTTLLIASMAAHAGPTSPSASALEAEQRRVEAQRRAMYAPQPQDLQRQRPRLPSEAAVRTELQRIEAERKTMFDPDNPAVKGTINAFPDVAVPSRAEIDIDALARRYAQKAQALRTEDLMVFVSFSMPTASLKRIVAETSAVGGTVILNGFKDNSWKATALAIKELGEHRGNVVVNPNAFVKYKVRAVPVVLLAKADAIDRVDQQGCALPDSFAALAGDVSLEYALEEMALREPDFQHLAKRYTRLLRGR